MSIEMWSSEKFRQEIAGLINHNAITESKNQKEIKERCVNFLSLMPELYGDELDRQKMWDRITNGIIVSLSKANKDWERFVNEMLVYIKADASKMASNEKFMGFMENMIEAGDDFRLAWLRCFETRHMILIPFARHAWNSVKGRKSPGKTSNEDFSAFVKKHTSKPLPADKYRQPVYNEEIEEGRGF